MCINWKSILFAAALLAASVTALGEQVAPNSFINKPAPTLDALIKQVQTDPEVKSRYMRHFGMTEQELLAFLRSLKKGEIKEDGAYLIYNTPETGEIRARVLFEKKGTPVWVDSNGNYILKVDCGNPMMRGTDYTRVDQTETVAMTSMTEVRELFVAQPPGISTTSVTATTVVPPIPVYDAITIAEVPPANPAEVGGQSIAPLALLVPFTGGLLLSGGGSGEPIPEPASMIALGLGVGGYLVARKRRKKA
jgi:hypothetical protein